MIKSKTKNERNLEKFLTLDPGSLEYITLRSELKQHLTDPGMLEKSSLVNDELKEETRIILDAFEAITNGMQNPDVFSSAEKISEESLLYFWKELIFAIKAFYEKNYEEMQSRLRKIDPDSPLSMFTPILLHLSGINNKISSNKRQKAFIENIIKDRSFISGVIAQLTESLEYDMEDLFLETSILMIHDLNKNYKEAARKFAIWSLKTASGYKYSPTTLISTCKKLFGNIEAYKYTAIAMSPEETDISLLFWIQSLLSGLKSGSFNDYETGAYLTIISRLAEKVKNSTDEFYLESLRGLIATIKFELAARFPDKSEYAKQSGSGYLDNPFEELIYLSSEYSSLEENIIRLETFKAKFLPKVEIVKPSFTGNFKSKKGIPVQLSLFD